jgi:hypothetical protein
MPLVRYFLFTGSLLLGLLFLGDVYLPRPAEAVTADVDRSIIRIHTSQRWPDAVPIDTSVPMPRATPPGPAVASATPIPASIREAKAYIPADFPAASPKSFDQPKPTGKGRHITRMARPLPPQAYPRLAYQTNWSSDAR